jgi:hypothetical protein
VFEAREVPLEGMSRCRVVTRLVRMSQYIRMADGRNARWQTFLLQAEGVRSAKEK